MVEPPTAAVLLPRFQVTTLELPPSVASTLAEAAWGQAVVWVASMAPALNTYSPRSLSVQDQLKLTPLPPAGTLAAAGDGPVHVAVPPSMSRFVGETPVTATLLLTFSVTVTAVPWVTTLTPPVLIAVSSTGGPGSLPGSAG